MRAYGLERVVSPPRVFPASAWELDNSRKLKRGEMRISLETVHVEGTSFKQICQDAANDEEKIKEKIQDIVIRRGKLHNPITDTGGLFTGVIEEIDKEYNNVKGFKVGYRVICNTSTAGIPMKIDKITSVSDTFSQFNAEGYAIALPEMPVIKRPDDISMALLLFIFNESGTIYNVSKSAKGKKRFGVVGNNMLMNLLYGYTIRRAAGPEAEIYCIFDRNTEITMQGEKIDEIMGKVFTEVSYHNLLRPVDCLKSFENYPQIDMFVNCADIPGAETLSVIATKSGGIVVFANFISNYNIALYITEATSRDLQIMCADGYLEKYDEFDFEIARELTPYIEGNLVPRSKIRRKGYKSQTEKSIFEYYNHYDMTIAEDFVVASPKMKNVIDEIMSVSRYDCNVLITGDTGVGKEKVANIIQKNSSRKLLPFIKINCAAISPNLMESEFFGYEKGAFTGADSKGKAGYFEEADNGIIFLDEVGELPLDIQAKLLRVIQDGEFMRVGGTKPIKTNVRIISATNRNLEEFVEQKRFRRDLYYRLNVFPISVPSLEERKEDIGPLVDNFVRKYNDKFGVEKYADDDAKENLARRKWPGNIRELENVVQRLIISSIGDAITSLDVIRELDGEVIGVSSVEPVKTEIDEASIDLTKTMETLEKNIIKYALEKHGSTRRAAKVLGISQTQLVRKKNKYEL
ncbi:MAG: sigma 54-interacting transcriptional regulator [Bacillota bacterium]|nr:sigma 54-interacting transcriptional regulator [Bacillota bacterium]